MGDTFGEEGVLYLHTLLHFNPAIFVIIHHLMDAPEGLQAIAIRLIHTRWRHHHAGVYMEQKGNGIISVTVSLHFYIQ